ncbi:UNKNOWN [Stylonychia lemnae]|uniref:Transmembrane protein 135 N-terminal domain-containing protein n=1 Tax=Stylonychia lemnae TaxID=5949 RepID=A0A077ZXY0_STYLE|nr:UNKNOWN [Stylonychia lemnae]|eukprot:CDW74092.1 UNKNOWN [Stylonychia lemnae]
MKRELEQPNNGKTQSNKDKSANEDKNIADNHQSYEEEKVDQLDQSGEIKKMKQQSILEKLNLPACMLTRTHLCKHKFGCYENTLRGWYRSFAMAFLVKSLFTHLPKIVKPVKLIKKILSIKGNTDAIKFALFASCMCAIYKAALCIMRRITGDDKINAGVAGFLSAFAILLDAKSRRLFLSLDVFVNMLEKRGIIKKINGFEVWAWAVMGCFNKYCMSYEPECLNNGFRKFYLKASAMTQNDIIMCDTWAKSLIKQKQGGQ